MRSILFAALCVFGMTACLRASTTDPDASSNGNGNNPTDGNGNTGSNNNNPDAGTTNHPDAGNTNPDAGNTNPDAGMSGPPCKNKVTSVGSGHHNAGQDCMNSCHFHGFTLAGTLYSAASGGSAISGASITVKDASGQTFDIVSQADGNFYTSNPVQFPVTVYASECQIQQAGVPMTATISSGGAGCNQGGCHTTSAQGRIHLP
jgi:hypothetical protein